MALHPSVHAEVWDRDMLTNKGTLDLTLVTDDTAAGAGVPAGALRYGFQAPPGQPGSGWVAVQRDSPLIPVHDDVVVLWLDLSADLGVGQRTEMFAFTVERIQDTHVRVGNRAQLLVRCSGTGLLDRFGEADIYPAMGHGRALYSATRTWNFASPELDTTSWPAASEVEKAFVNERFGLPEAFIDPDAYWVWNSQQPGSVALGDVTVTVFEDNTWVPVGWTVLGDGFPPPGVGNMDEFLGDAGPYINLLEDGTWLAEGGWDPVTDGFPIGPPFVPADYEQPSSFADPGDVYLVTTFTKTGYGQVELWAAFDDAGEVWVDGIQVLVVPGPYKGKAYGVAFWLDDGDHRIAIKGTNFNLAKAGVLCSVVEITGGGVYGDVICRTDSSWKISAYPDDPPGFEYGRILRIAFAEAVARGCLPEWLVGFGDTDDSATDPWGTTPIFSVPVGASMLTMIRRMAEQGVRFAAGPGSLTLQAWVPGSLGQGVDHSDVVYALPTGDPDVDQIVSLDHDTVHPRTNVYLVHYDGPWAEIGNPTLEALHGRREGMLQVGSAKTLQEAITATNGLLAITEDERRTTVLEVVPLDATHCPYWNVVPMDLVDAPDRTGTAVEQEVASVSVRQGPDGRPRFSMELNNLLTRRDDAMAALVRTRLAGGLGSEQSQPARPRSPVEVIDPGAQRLSFSPPDYAFTVGVSEDVNLAGTFHLLFVFVTLTEASTSGPVEGRLLLSGTPVVTATGSSTISVPEGVNVLYVPLLRDLVVSSDVLAFEITDIGTDARGLVAVVRYR